MEEQDDVIEHEYVRLDPASLVVDPKFRFRKEEPGFDRIVESVREIGVVNPIWLRPDGKTLIFGHRRLAAALEVGLSTVPCNICHRMTEPIQWLWTFIESNRKYWGKPK